MSWLFSQALMDSYANLPCLQARAEVSSAESCLAGEPSVPSSTTPTQRVYLWRDKTTDALSRFRSGMTFARSTGDRGADVLTSFLAGFPARTFPPPEKAQESTASAADCGPKWPASLAKYDPDSRSWKTRQCLLGGGLAEFSETFPRWGMTRAGELFRQPTPSFLLEIRAYITSVKESGLSRQIGTPLASNKVRSEKFSRDTPSPMKFVRAPTPTVCGLHNRKGASATSGDGLSTFVKRLSVAVATPTATDGRKWNAKTKQQRKDQGSSVRICNEDRGDGTPIGGQLNPPWVEWLMGWPVGWTDLGPLGTAKFQSWHRSHGEFLRKDGEA